MRTVIFFCFLLSFASAHAQPTPEMRRIDSLVNVINSSNLPGTIDSIVHDYPQMGLFMRIYLTTVIDGNQLKKFVNYITGYRIDNGIKTETTGSNNFYFDNNTLIKVEENMVEKSQGKDEKAGSMSWYYSGDQYFYPHPFSEKNEERAQLLLTMAKGMLKQIVKE